MEAVMSSWDAGRSSPYGWCQVLGRFQAGDNLVAMSAMRVVSCHRHARVY